MRCDGVSEASSWSWTSVTTSSSSASRSTPALVMLTMLRRLWSGSTVRSTRPRDFELGERGGDVASIDAGVAAEVGLARRSPFLECRQQPVVIAAQPVAVRLEAVAEQTGRAGVGAADQPGRAVA